jgi:hypothetical protein
MKTGSRAWIASAFAVAVAANALALAGVAYNRAGEDSRLAMSERELSPDAIGVSRENSGVSLRILWRVADPKHDPGSYYGWVAWASTGAPAWLDRAKMADMGFDVTVPDADIGRRAFKDELAREVFIVLEFDGAAYRESLEAAPQAAEQLRAQKGSDAAERAAALVERERTQNSRLFAVDAGTDAAALRSKYPDRSHYAIVRGRVAPAWRLNSSYHGRIESLSVSSINVPVEMHGAVGNVPPRMGRFSPDPSSDARGRAFDAVVAFGQRLEPWLVSLTTSKAPR